MVRNESKMFDRNGSITGGTFDDISWRRIDLRYRGIFMESAAGTDWHACISLRRLW